MPADLAALPRIAKIDSGRNRRALKTGYDAREPGGACPQLTDKTDYTASFVCYVEKKPLRRSCTSSYRFMVLTRNIPMTRLSSSTSPGSPAEQDDRRRLRHPLTGGVILFARNWKRPPAARQAVRRSRLCATTC
jgi:hypothetical protein